MLGVFFYPIWEEKDVLRKDEENGSRERRTILFIFHRTGCFFRASVWRLLFPPFSTYYALNLFGNDPGRSLFLKGFSLLYQSPSGKNRLDSQSVL